jgi:hypothetical protein
VHTDSVSSRGKAFFPWLELFSFAFPCSENMFEASPENICFGGR